jgi:hypothetical protein
MIYFAYLVMAAFVPFAMVLFALLGPRRGAAAVCVIGWLFLPNVGIKFNGVPPIGKGMLTAMGLLFAMAVFDSGAVARFKPRWHDLGILMFCLSPLPSSLLNDLGWHDGFTNILNTVVAWGVPYFIGRVYFASAAGLKDAISAVLLGTLVMVPLVLFELKMSPQTHLLIYGTLGHLPGGNYRYGGYRPVLFLGNGLMLAVWFSSAMLAMVIVWRTRVIRSLWGFPAWSLVMTIGLGVIFTRTLAAWLFVTTGLGAYWVGRRFKTTVPIILLLSLSVGYIGLRGSGVWTGENAVALVDKVFGNERGESFGFRVKNEILLAAKARERWVFGWGGWGRNLILDDRGENTTVIDGYWIIIFGTSGTVGLVLLVYMYTMATVCGLRAAPARFWHRAETAPIIIAVFYTVFALANNIPNADINPVYGAFIGALTGLAAMPKSAAPIRRRGAVGGPTARRVVSQVQPPSRPPIPFSRR